MTELDGLPITTVARTIIDLAATFDDLASRGRRGIGTVRFTGADVSERPTWVADQVRAARSRAA